MILGSSRFKLKGGATKLIVVRLNRSRAKKLLAHRDRARVKATVRNKIKLKSGKTKTKVTKSVLVLVKPGS